MEVKFITHPSVHLLSGPMFYEHPLYKLPTTREEEDLDPDAPEGEVLEGTPSEQLIAHAGKGCYDAYGRDGRSIAQHIDTLIGSGHGSVLEHANVSLFIAGISRGCSHEFVRHRAGFAYSQRSTRYVDESECNVVLEPYIAELYERALAAMNDERVENVNAKGRELLHHYCSSLEESVNNYRWVVNHLMEEAPGYLNKVGRRKWARGKARQLLPIALETRMTVTANLRAWRHFLCMRSNQAAEAEMRRLAERVYMVLHPCAPKVFDDLGKSAVLKNGFLEFAPEQAKV